MEPGKSLIVCQSTHHGNTDKVARAMAEVLGCSVQTPEEVDRYELGRCDLVGFGSGIDFGRMHFALKRLVLSWDTTPRNVFLFSTAGLPCLSRLWHRRVRKPLATAGSSVLGEFCCRGWDSVGPLALVGGLNRRHPDDHDLTRAHAFARRIEQLSTCSK